MALGLNIAGAVSGVAVDSTTAGHLDVALEPDVKNKAAFIGGARTFQENDQGLLTGVIDLRSTEVDSDFRGRVSLDTLVDQESFNYTSQNTGKHYLVNTTLTGTFTQGQFTTNGSSITTVNTGLSFTTYAAFPLWGAHTTSVDVTASFSAQPVTNTFIEWGVGIANTQVLAPLDGIYFRLTSAGLQGVVNYNNVETTTGPFPATSGTGTWTYTNGKRYQFIAYASSTEAQFWVNDGSYTYKLGSINLPTASGRISVSDSGQFFIKHRILGGAAGGVIQFAISSYSVRVGGSNISDSLSNIGNRLFGSYQGLSSGVMGSTANYANSANPTAAVPTNTTAALGTGMGGQFWETDTLAVNTDGIICSYQVPAHAANYSGRRMKITGVSLASYVQTALTGGGYNTQWCLAFGHTNVSLATTEAVSAKAPRRIALPEFTQLVAAGATAPAVLTQISGNVDFSASPIYVNPGEFVALVRKKIGTAPSAGVIGHVISFRYSWE